MLCDQHESTRAIGGSGNSPEKDKGCIPPAFEQQPGPTGMPTGCAPFSKFADGRITKIPLDEPIFLLRASDPMAANLIRAWCSQAQNLGVNQAKIENAYVCADAMDAWPVKKLPD